MKHNEDITIMGLSLITSNDEAMNHNTIGKLWERFLNIPHSSFKQVDTGSVYSVYSDYENETKGKYRVTLGYACKNPSSIPEGMHLVKIPSGPFKVIQAKSPTPKDIVDAWMQVWSDLELPRRFHTDFELYEGDKAYLYIGLK